MCTHTIMRRCVGGGTTGGGNNFPSAINIKPGPPNKKIYAMNEVLLPFVRRVYERKCDRAFTDIPTGTICCRCCRLKSLHCCYKLINELSTPPARIANIFAARNKESWSLEYSWRLRGVCSILTQNCHKSKLSTPTCLSAPFGALNFKKGRANRQQNNSFGIRNNNGGNIQKPHPRQQCGLCALLLALFSARFVLAQLPQPDAHTPYWGVELELGKRIVLCVSFSSFGTDSTTHTRGTGNKTRCIPMSWELYAWLLLYLVSLHKTVD